MSELQAALLAIGFGVIVTVYIFGWRQQRHYRRKFGAAFKSGHADALYQDSIAEPAEQAYPPASTIEDTPIAEEKITGAATTTDEPPEEMKAVQPPAAVSMDESCLLLDARSDFIIELRLAEASHAGILDGLWQRKFDFGKPVQVCGLLLNGQQWERAIAESHTLYSRFRIAVQLVDRGGAVSIVKLTDFRDLVLGIAKRIKADSVIPDIDETHHLAIELDSLCAEVDQMVGVNLVPPGERLLAGSKIAQAAAMQGMTLESDGAFHLLDTDGHSLFTLINKDTKPFQHHTLETFSTTGITLLLDVPRVKKPADQFDSMVHVAHELARELQLNLVDDHRVVLSDPGLARIRAQIAAIEAKMLENTIVPGSAQARRLFS
jgi:hypothetical protein